MIGPLEPADSPDVLRRAFSCFPSGVVAVCAHESPSGERPAGERPAGPATQPEYIGMAASSFSTVSLDPPLVSVCVQNSSSTWPRLRARATLGVSVFAHHQADLCRQLAGPAPSRFADVEVAVADGGALFLHGAAAQLACEVLAEYPGGDHTVVLLRIKAVAADPQVDPLVFHASSFRTLHVDPSGPGSVTGTTS